MSGENETSLLAEYSKMSPEEKEKVATKLKEEGNLALRSKDVEKAIDCYSQAIFLCPDDPVFYSNRSAAQLSAGRWEFAMHDAQAAIHLKPSWFKGYCRMAEALIASEQFPQAVLALEDGMLNIASAKKRQQEEKGEEDSSVKDLQKGEQELRTNLERAVMTLREKIFRGIKATPGSDQQQQQQQQQQPARPLLPLPSDKFFVDGSLSCALVARDCAFTRNSPNLQEFAADCFVGISSLEDGVHAVIGDGGPASGLAAITTLCAVPAVAAKATLALSNILECVSASPTLMDDSMEQLWEWRFVVSAVRVLARARSVNLRSVALIFANCMWQGKTTELFLGPSADDRIEKMQQAEAREERRVLRKEEKRRELLAKKRQDLLSSVAGKGLDEVELEQMLSKITINNDDEKQLSSPPPSPQKIETAEEEEEKKEVRFKLAFSLFVDAARCPDPLVNRTALQAVAFFLTHTHVGSGLVTRDSVPPALISSLVQVVVAEDNEELERGEDDEGQQLDTGATIRFAEREAWGDRLTHPAKRVLLPCVFALQWLFASSKKMREEVTAALDAGKASERLKTVICRSRDDALD